MAAVPDFGALASAQANENDDATRRTTWSQRPDQTNSMGSITWNQTPDGRWVNSSQLNGTGQSLYDSTMWGSLNLGNQINQGVNSNGLMGWGSSDLTGNLGAMPQVGQYNQQVIDAWNALQNPALDKAEASQRQRLAAQGITNGSSIMSQSDRTLGANRTDAGNKAILAGYQQGNTEYDQALKARGQRYTENLGQSQLQNSMRQQQFGERTTAYDAAMKGSASLQSTRAGLNVNDWASKVPTGAAYVPETIYGAAQDTFNANRQNENADIAKSQARTDSAINALRAAGGVSGIGTAIGGIGSALGSIGTGASNAWDWASNMWRTDGASGNNNFIMPQDWENQNY